MNEPETPCTIQVSLLTLSCSTDKKLVLVKQASFLSSGCCHPPRVGASVSLPCKGRLKKKTYKLRLLAQPKMNSC